jgi:hypothetical protein
MIRNEKQEGMVRLESKGENEKVGKRSSEVYLHLLDGDCQRILSSYLMF